LFEGWEGHCPPVYDGALIDSDSSNLRFSVELDMVLAKQQQKQQENAHHDSRRESATSVEAQLKRLNKPGSMAPLGDHPLRAHPVRPPVEGSWSGSYYSANP
jgi:hypothetical protein